LKPVVALAMCAELVLELLQDGDCRRESGAPVAGGRRGRRPSKWLLDGRRGGGGASACGLFGETGRCGGAALLQ